MEQIYKRKYTPKLEPEKWVDVYKKLASIKRMTQLPLIHRKICIEIIENKHTTAELHRLCEADKNYSWLRTSQGKPMSTRNIQIIFFSYFPELQRKRREKDKGYAEKKKIRQEQTKLKRKINQCICYRCGSTSNLEIHHMIPISMGGTNAEGNVIILCHKCHEEATKYLRSITAESVKHGRWKRISHFWLECSCCGDTTIISPTTVPNAAQKWTV